MVASVKILYGAILLFALWIAIKISKGGDLLIGIIFCMRFFIDQLNISSIKIRRADLTYGALFKLNMICLW